MRCGHLNCCAKCLLLCVVLIYNVWVTKYLCVNQEGQSLKIQKLGSLGWHSTLSSSPHVFLDNLEQLTFLWSLSTHPLWPRVSLALVLAGKHQSSFQMMLCFSLQLSFSHTNWSSGTRLQSPKGEALQHHYQRLLPSHWALLFFHKVLFTEAPTL